MQIIFCLLIIIYIFIIMTSKENIRHIEAKAIRERLIFKQFKDELNSFCIKYTPYNGKDSHDLTCFQVTNNLELSNAMIEIKVRECSVRAFNGYVIEKHKYDYLMSHSKQYTNLYYINFFADGYIIWDLKKIKPNKLEWKVDEYRKDNQHTSKIDKIAANLMTWDAAIIVFKEIRITEALAKAYKIWNRLNKHNNK
jgi:hypothetical protein